MHAGWNLLTKRQGTEGRFIDRMLCIVAVTGFIPAIWCELRDPVFDSVILGYVLGAGACCGLYYLFLVLGYKSGDFTFVYPVARSVPVLIIALADVVRGRNPSVGGWIGMLLILAGCLLAPHTKFSEIRLRKYFTRNTIWMLLTALCTVGYTLFDKAAAETVRHGGAGVAARYCYVFFTVSYAVYAVSARLVRVSRDEKTVPGWGWACVGCALNYLAYWLILWVYQLVERASYIVAFRQFSIVIGVVVAFAAFRERGVAVRITAAVAITAGLVLIGVFG